MIGYSRAFNELYGPKPIEGKSKMNERIKQIAGQALDSAVPQTWTTLTAYDLNKFTEAFAELLVRECCSIADEFEVYVNQGGLVDRIKEHFGVDQ